MTFRKMRRKSATRPTRPTPCPLIFGTSRPDQAAGQADLELLGKEKPDSEAEDEENEKKAVVINAPKQERP